MIFLIMILSRKLHAVMDVLIYNRGFSHILDKIFLEVPTEDLINCLPVCKSWYELLNDPQFWMKKCPQKDSSEKKKRRWKFLINKTKTTKHLKQNVIKLFIKICLKSDDDSMISPFHAMLKFKDIPLLILFLKSPSNDKVMEIKTKQLDGFDLKYTKELINDACKDLDKVEEWLDLRSNNYKNCKKYQKTKNLQAFKLCHTNLNLNRVLKNIMNSHRDELIKKLEKF